VSGQIDEECSSILIVVGREDTGDLEAQIRGSRYAWDVRFISVDALLRLMFLKEEVDDPATIQRIGNVLIPREFTRLDEISELAAAERFLQYRRATADPVRRALLNTPLDEALETVAERGAIPPVGWASGRARA